MASEDELGVLKVVRELHSRHPFNPFRIIMGSGESYVVENSELLAIGQSQLIYCRPHSDNVVYLRFSQISEVEDLGTQRVAS